MKMKKEEANLYLVGVLMSLFYSFSVFAIRPVNWAVLGIVNVIAGRSSWYSDTRNDGLAHLLYIYLLGMTAGIILIACARFFRGRTPYRIEKKAIGLFVLGFFSPPIALFVITGLSISQLQIG